MPSDRGTRPSGPSGVPRWALALLTAMGVGCVYALTLYPSVPGGDTGELIGAVATGGVPHPPGFPLYVLVTRPFLGLPILSVEWRANFASAASGAAAAAMLAWIVAVLTGRRWAGLAAAATFAFSPTVWLHAVGAEVFSLNNLLIASGLALLAAMDRAARTEPAAPGRLDRFVYAGAFALGLAVSNHPTALLFNGIFVAAMIWRARQRQSWRARLRWAALAGCVAAGALPYVYLPLAAARHPLISWGQTDTLHGFMAHVLRSEYGALQLNQNIASTATPLVRQLAFYVGDLVRQFTWIGVGLAAWGLVRAAAARESRFLAVTTTAAVAVYLVALHALAGFPLDQPLFHGIVARFWQAPDLLVCLWIGWGLAFLPLPPSALAVAAVALAGGQLALHVRAGNHRDDVMVHDYGIATLQSLPPRALVLMRGDLVSNTARYFHVVEHVRPDVRLLDQELLTYRWMDAQIRRQMPDVVLPGTHYDIAEPGAYSLRALIDANIRSRPIVVCGGTKPGDASLAGVYRLMPIGLCDRVVPASESIDVQEWLAADAAARPRFHADMRRVPDPESWEHVAWLDYWDVSHRTAVACLTLAIDRHDDPALLRMAATAFDRLIAEDPQPPAVAYKNLGLALARLAPADPSAGPRAVAAWQRYLQIGPADDPQRPAIESAVRTLTAAGK